MGSSALVVGTLSFELDDWEMTLSAKKRRKLIRDVAFTRRPDLLLCAGFSVDREADVKWLSKQQLPTACYAEAETRKANWNYFLFGAAYEKPVRMKRQLFATRDETNPQEVRKLERANSRFHEACDLSACLLVCGELNIVKGRDQPVFVSENVANRVWSSRIVLNPNHDRMSHPGTLDAKRKFLSRSLNGDDRLYVNAANWHINKPDYNGGNQRKSAETLHTFYRNGKKLIPINPIDSAKFEYREVELKDFC